VCIVHIDFFFQAEDGIRDRNVTGVQTCALPIWSRTGERWRSAEGGRNSFRLYLLCRWGEGGDVLGAGRAVGGLAVDEVLLDRCLGTCTGRHGGGVPVPLDGQHARVRPQVSVRLGELVARSRDVPAADDPDGCP